ncbi:DUF202 domain-containing protein [Arthrobacter agilis]|uniref:YidH family protein n=1 Tax=Arthrobacter agilis TaxID=37921 RepID=UPI000B357640|nr:hypothetical protein B8W74_05935 [Arthrobacter agilis]PPB46722.1 DUF202 domain-containing protein [Arthrobacter agilis]TPV24936.1 DUF202 domain-containing protein [Arthrobacter agilis]VDR31105.1 Inner membrane protein yidH [Arthrobacter agilis]
MGGSSSAYDGPVTSSSEHRPEGRGAWAARLLGGGVEPDPRFTLANERTFLAWIRTALALLAGGIAVEAFTPAAFDPALRTFLAVTLLVLAMIMALAAGLRWLRVERAMRRRAPLPLPLLVPVLAAGGALIAGAVLVVVLVAPQGGG